MFCSNTQGVPFIVLLSTAAVTRRPGRLELSAVFRYNIIQKSLSHLKILGARTVTEESYRLRITKYHTPPYKTQSPRRSDALYRSGVCLERLKTTVKKKSGKRITEHRTNLTPWRPECERWHTTRKARLCILNVYTFEENQRSLL